MHPFYYLAIIAGGLAAYNLGVLVGRVRWNKLIHTGVLPAPRKKGAK